LKARGFEDDASTRRAKQKWKSRDGIRSIGTSCTHGHGIILRAAFSRPASEGPLIPRLLKRNGPYGKRSSLFQQEGYLSRRFWETMARGTSVCAEPGSDQRNKTWGSGLTPEKIGAARLTPCVRVLQPAVADDHRPTVDPFFLRVRFLFAALHSPGPATAVSSGKVGPQRHFFYSAKFNQWQVAVFRLQPDNLARCCVGK